MRVNLRRAGFDVIAEYTDGAQALKGIRDTKPDLALLDIVMVEMTGLEVAEKIHEEFPDMNLLMITSMGQDGIKDRIKHMKAQIVVKPFLDDYLLEILWNIRNAKH